MACLRARVKTPSAAGREEDWALLTGGSEKDLVGKKKWRLRKQELNCRVQSILFSKRPCLNWSGLGIN